VRLDDGTELFHVEVGSGLPCLVMHGGLGVDHTQFREALDPLGDVLRLVYYDHRGNGRSGRPPLPTLTLEQFAADADALRGHLGFERVAVLGHSYGGCLALQYALRYPRRVSHLVLVGTTPAWDHADEVIAELRRRSPSARVLSAFLDPPTDVAAFARSQHLVTAALGVYDCEPARVERLFGATVWSPAACARSRELMADCDVAARLGEIEAPALVLVGRHDVFCPPSQAERLRCGIPNAEMIVFERSGHYPFVEEAEAFRGAVRSWLSAGGSATRACRSAAAPLPAAMRAQSRPTIPSAIGMPNASAPSPIAGGPARKPR
jgi:proline iminopeptidase